MRNFKICKTKSCMTKIFDSNEYCNDHNKKCRPIYVFCNEKLGKTDNFCSKHQCEYCPKSKFACDIHYCKNDNCSKTKMTDSEYCDDHTCSICNGKWSCPDHECKVKNCHDIIIKDYNFCKEHTRIGDIEYYPSIEAFNNELNIYYHLHEKDYHYYYFHSFEELVHHNKQKTFDNALWKIAQKKNASITMKDASFYNLACTSYCSDGYCTCRDLMPHIYIPERYKESISEDDEKIYLLSEIALTYNDYMYKAWTIPKIFIDEFKEIWDGTDEQIENMIQFEYIQT